MRSFWLAAKIAVVFLVVMGIFLAVTLHLFTGMVMGPLVHGELHGTEAHQAFVLVVLQLGLVAMVLMVALSVYITAPLRRMSRSMDRIAAGDLEHRVPVRGRDEGAAMGRSFNAMADRVRAMIVGQKELMAGVSHELRSPLTRMKMSLELLRQEKESGGPVSPVSPVSPVDRIADLESDIDALDALVEELLLASRIDLRAVPLQLEPSDLEDLCREAWARVVDEAAAQGTTFKACWSEDERWVQADRSLVVRLLGNLFENAVRHAGPGRVTVSSKRRGDRVEITVGDEGPGVEEEDLARLFEPFFRADRSRSRKTGAGGLGLMIVRRAVEAHGGSVEARRREPQGLGVSFDLPVASPVWHP